MFIPLAKSISEIILNPHSRSAQSAMIYISTIGNVGFSFIGTTITANIIGAEDYGNMKFVVTIWGVLNTLISFGFLQSACRVMVVEKEERKMRQVFGAAIFLALVMGLAITLITLLLSLVIDPVFHINLGLMIALLAPLAIILPLQTAFSLMLQASNRMYLLAGLNLFPPFLYLVIIALAAYFRWISLELVLILQEITFIPVFLIIIFVTRPSLTNLREWLNKIRIQNKTYGFPVYLGAISAIGTAQINRLAISYWTDTTQQGYYSLASSLVMPLSLLPNAVGTSSYRQFADQNKMSRKLLLVMAVTSILAMLGFVFFCVVLFPLFFKSDFSAVGPMALVMMFAAIMHGFGDFFNRFLGAHGMGRAIRNIALTNGVVNVIGIFVLTPIWGTWGAIITWLMMAGVYFGQELYWYRRMQKRTI
jgi:O-antigen/teichoic acid export membrane protein